jgi:hypothetical protein
MKIISITIKPEECVVKWESSNGAKWSVSSARQMGSRFGDAVKGLSTVAAKSINHNAELMAVRAITVSENKKGVTFVKLAGVLDVVSNDPTAKPGKFATPKIEITLFANAEMKAMEEAAKEYARECAAE